MDVIGKIPIQAKYLICVLLLLNTGCAEGPLWKTGHLAPWVRQKWEEEERIAAGYRTRVVELRSLVEQASTGSPVVQDQAAQRLKQIFEQNSALLLRIEAVELLGQLKTESSREVLRKAVSDPNPDVRMAAIRAWKSIGGESGVRQMQHIVGSDTNLDVRIAATRALGEMNHPAAVQALSMVLDDNDPAIQYRATQSLEAVTGQNFGTHIAAWKEYIRTSNPVQNASPDATNFDVRQASTSEADGAFSPDR